MLKDVYQKYYFEQNYNCAETLLRAANDYYDLKVAQGRRHYNALGHIAHKLVRVIHKMMTDNVAFNLA